MVNVAYYRVSTKKQGQSGLGLDAQKMAVKMFLGKDPDFELTDIESGSINSRIGLDEAILKVSALGPDGRLVVAKLDRLSREVHFISGLMKSKINFCCCDMPEMTPFSLHIYASVAEQELRMISERTKNSIKAKIKKEHDKGNLNYKWGSGAGLSSNRIV
ncbi:MAG: recombinase family protein, partial [Chitinophagaceae bacterium]